MVEICDATISKRAVRLREALYKMGCPCCTVVCREIRDYFPAKLIVTFDDVYEKVWDVIRGDIHILVLGEKFINSTTNAESVKDESELITRIDEMLRGENSERFTFGVRDGRVFVAKAFLEICGRDVFLSHTEYMIFLYLYSFADSQEYSQADVIYSYCSRKSRIVKTDVANSIAVKVAKINGKLGNAGIAPVIHSQRGKGYYAERV